MKPSKIKGFWWGELDSNQRPSCLGHGPRKLLYQLSYLLVYSLRFRELDFNDFLCLFKKYISVLPHKNPSSNTWEIHGRYLVPKESPL